MYGGESEIERVIAPMQVMQIAGAIEGAGVAAALRGQRSVGLHMLLIMNIDGVMPLTLQPETRRLWIGRKGIQTAVARVARGQCTIEECIAHPGTFHYAVRFTDPKRVQRIGRRNGIPHE